jgi:hypothetical protein
MASANRGFIDIKTSISHPFYTRKQQCPQELKNNSFWGFYGDDEPLVGGTLFEAIVTCFEHKKASLLMGRLFLI